MSNDHFFNILSIFFQASQVITVNENLPLTSVEPEVFTDRRTVKICCCIPKGDVLLNAWYVYLGVTYFVFIQVGYTHDASKHAYICKRKPTP